MATTTELLKQRFREASDDRDAILAKSGPLRVKRDAIMAKARDLERTADPLNEQIRKAEAGLFELQNEIATISRALSGKTT